MGSVGKLVVAVTTMRKYSAQEIIALIDILKSSGDVPPSELAGMERLGRLSVFSLKTCLTLTSLKRLRDGTDLLDR